MTDYEKTVPAMRSWVKTEAPRQHNNQGVNTSQYITLFTMGANLGGEPSNVDMMVSQRQAAEFHHITLLLPLPKEGYKKSQRDLGPAPAGIAWAISPPGHIHCCTIGLSMAAL